jgi:hypothetical protein
MQIAVFPMVIAAFSPDEYRWVFRILGTNVPPGIAAAVVFTDRDCLNNSTEALTGPHGQA